MTDVLTYIVLTASVLIVLWRARAKLLYGCDIMLALARGLYGKKNLYLSDGFECGHTMAPLHYLLSALHSGMASCNICGISNQCMLSTACLRGLVCMRGHLVRRFAVVA